MQRSAKIRSLADFLVFLHQANVFTKTLKITEFSEGTW